MRESSRGRRAGAAGVMTALLLTAACSEPAGGKDPVDHTVDATPSAAPSSATSSASPSAVADPEHATAPPGEVERPLLSAVILVVGPETLDEELVERISRLEGVAATTAISLKQVPIENRLYDIAAVDAAEY